MADEVKIVGTRVDVVSRRAAADRVLEWARHGESRYVCLANTHMLVEARHDPELRAALATSDLTCCDGMPLVWMQRALGVAEAEHVRGADLMLEVLSRAGSIPVGLYGSTQATLDRLAHDFRIRFPDMRLSYVHSPPFRALTDDEQGAVREDIASAGVRILFVGLGCPKQERWMAAHRGRVAAVMLGVGAAFDMHAGVYPQAPRWMQNSGLEWLDRLRRDPRRLLRRYARNNPAFVWLAARQLLRGCVRGARTGNE